VSIDFTIEDGLARLHINRAEKRNALTKDMRIAFAEAVEGAARDPAVRALLLSAAGPSFCAGADLEQFGHEGPAEARLRLQQAGHRLIRALHDIEKPVVAAVRGHAIGLGWAIVLATDIVVSSTTAKFSMPFRTRGLVADAGAIWFLTRELGTLRAKDLIYSERTVAADEARSLGLVTEVVDDAALDARALERAQDLASGPTFSLGLMRKLFAISRGPSLAEYLELESLMSPQLRHTEDFKEGIAAFREKHKPEFKGR
jgi:2-(1,2-epoxy-1,2-dihydrophenyl)acetyl-CoA isomerase